MTTQQVPNTDIEYYLTTFNKNGEERTDDPDAESGRMSEQIKKELEDKKYTDVFFMSHGWKGDIPAAIDQYDRWIRAMLQCDADRSRIRESRPGFTPLLVGLHWPSLPFGDETHPDAGVSFDTATVSLEEMVLDAAEKTSDSEAAIQSLRTIITAALDDIAPPQLSDEVQDAYRTLYREIGLAAEGVDATPGNDTDQFDPERVYEDSLDTSALSFGGFSLGDGLLSVLRQLSFWTMKARAKTIGESGAATLLRDLQKICDQPDRDVRFHLMGHSFGCIVVSAAIAGAKGNAPLIKPVDTAYLVQGALSLWSYCSDIPKAQGKSGYFYGIPRDGKVAGPMITTQSEYDKAVGTLYPIGAGLKRQVEYAPGELPKYGGLGTYGVRGPGVTIEDRNMLPLDGNYKFQNGRIYNLESSAFINEGEGISGAHSDIDKPEVAHAFWDAMTPV